VFDRRRIIIDQLMFTGPERTPVAVQFKPGVNIIWGASNTGKSFVRKSIDYLLGGELPALPPEGTGVDNYLLWLTLAGDQKVTLRSSALGGDIYKADGHLEAVGEGSPGYEVFSRKHVNSPNVSRFLLASVGYREAQLLKNERAEKAPFSLRLVMRYLLIDETRMIDEKSLLLAHNMTVTSEDKGLLKFLLTGVDGSSIAQVRSGDQLKAAKEGQIELLSQMAEQLRKVIDETVETSAVIDDLASAEREKADLLEIVEERQISLDALALKERGLSNEIQGYQARVAELNALKARFDELARVYASDIDRLEGLEEGGFLLQRFATINCPLCGACPDHQMHDHGLGGIEEQRHAVELEIEKIRAEARDLAAALADADAEILKVEQFIVVAGERLNAVCLARVPAAQGEVSARSIFLSASTQCEKLESDLDHRRRVAELEAQIVRIKAATVQSRQRADGIDVNLDLSKSEAHELSTVVKQVLKAWNYPGADAVHFEKGDQDIVVDGKRRRDNGAGVRALLHAAFKIGVLVYCIEKGRPHPGFVILDSPLFAYRPAEEDRFEDLTDDELELRDADVATHFYRYLQGMADHAQFIVIENHKSDQDVVRPYANYQFTKNPSVGRAGLFV
jgi:polyhydroxyalkanoate synthesis regulator phasin